MILENVKVKEENFCLSVSGVFSITEGEYTKDIRYSAKLTESNINGYVNIHNYDIDIEDTYKNGIEVDYSEVCFIDFPGINDTNLFRIMCDVIHDSFKVKIMYGNVIVIQSLSLIERQKLLSLDIINNWNDRPDFDKRQFRILNDNKNGVPSLQQLIDFRNSL